MAKRVRSGGRPGARRFTSRRSGPPGGAINRAPNGLARPASVEEPRLLEAPELNAGELDEPEVEADEVPRASSAHLTETELRRAEELQDELAARERAAMAEQIRRRTRVRAGQPELDDVNAPLRVRASHEYAYVARDVRRIIATGAVMVAILAILAILINVVGVISI